MGEHKQPTPRKPKFSLELKDVCQEQIDYVKSHPKNALYVQGGGVNIIVMIRTDQYICFFCGDNHKDHR